MGESKSEIKNVGDPSEYKCPLCEAEPAKLCFNKLNGKYTNYHEERIKTAQDDVKARLAKEVLRFVAAREWDFYGWSPVVYHWEYAGTTRVYDLRPERPERGQKPPTRTQALMKAFVFCHENGLFNVVLE